MHSRIIPRFLLFIILFSLLSSNFLLLAKSDPILEDTAPYEKRFLWEFDNPSNYTLSNTTIENGTAILAYSPLSINITSEQDFNNGTMVNVDSLSVPGDIRLGISEPQWNQNSIQLIETDLDDTYITNYSPTINYGASEQILVGNYENNIYRALISLNSSLLSSIPWDADQVNASLSLYQISGDPGEDIYANMSFANWTEGDGDWNGTLCIIWVNETVGTRRTNEPVIIEIPISGPNISDPDRQLLLYDNTEQEYPSRILNRTYENGNLVSIKMGFAVTIDSLDTILFELKYRNFSLIPEYRDVDPEPSFRGGGFIADLETAPVMADLNFDGYLDIVIFHKDAQSLQAYNGSQISPASLGTPLWIPAYIVGEDLQYSLTVADVNIDGEVEIVYTARNVGVKVVSSSGTLLFDGSIAGISSDGTAQPAVADINLDGIPEILISDKDRFVYAISGIDGTLVWQTDVGEEVSAIAIGDLNESAGFEVAVTQNNGEIAAINSSGDILWEERPSDKNYGKSFGVGYIDNDTFEDIIVGIDDAGGNVIALYGNNGTEMWRFNAINNRYGDGLAIADINNDGENETIVKARENRKLIALTNNGSMLWSFDLANESRSPISLADFDGDSILEIFFADEKGAVQVINSTGSRIKIIQVAATNEKIRNPPLFGDIDGDSSLDMLTVAEDTMKIYEIPGFSQDWRMRSRVSLLKSSIAQSNSPDGVELLNITLSPIALPEFVVNWTHANNSDVWNSEGGDFNDTSFDSFSSGSLDSWVDINITELIVSWLSSNRTELPSLFLLPKNDSTKLIEFASADNDNVSRHPILNISYHISRYESTGYYLSDAMGFLTKNNWIRIIANWSTDANTNITMKIRSGDSSIPNLSWTDWKSVNFTGNSSYAIISERAKYIQLNVTLSTTNSSFTPILHSIEIGRIEYITNGYLETEDAVSPEIIRRWNKSWAEYEARGNSISLSYSTDGGGNWSLVPMPSGDIKNANTTTGKIRLRLSLTSNHAATTPVIFNISASYSLYSVTPTPPYIDPRIPDQYVFEDSPPWIVDLSPHLHDANDNQTLLYWYIVNESVVSVSGENITGNMEMTLSIPSNVYGIDVVTLFLVDSTSMTTSQDFNVTIQPENDPPFISPVIPNQLAEEDTPPWKIDLTPFIHDAEDPLSGLKWYAINESFVQITGENVTGNELMTLYVPSNVHGTDVITFILVDSQGLTASQDITVSVTSINDPPTIDHIGDFTVHYDIPYEFDFNPYVQDIETPHSLLNLSTIGSNSSYVSIDGLKATFLLPEELNGTAVEIEISVDDGDLMSSIKFNIMVSDDFPPHIKNQLPDITLYQGELAIGLLNLSEYFDDIDDETLFFYAGNFYVQIVIHQDTRLIDFYAPTNWYGVESVTFKAVDPDNARAEDTISITILKVAQPLVFSQMPDLVVRYEVPYSLDLRPYVTDPDTPIQDIQFQSNMSQNISFSSGIMTVLFPSEDSIGMTYSINLTADDGDFTAYQIFNIRVGDNYPPSVGLMHDHVFIEDHPEDFPLSGSLSQFFFDVENSTASLDYSILIWDTNVTAWIYQDAGDILIEYNQTKDWFGDNFMTIRATDYYGAFVEKTVSLTILPENDQPLIQSLGTITVVAGERYVHDISSNISDIETPTEMLLITSNIPEYVEGFSGCLIISFPQNYTSGENSITENVIIIVRDLEGGEASTVLTIVIEKAPDDPKQIYLWWLLLIIATTAALLGFILVTKVRKGPFAIHDMILIHNTGMLLARFAKSDTVKVDDDIFSGMLTAVLDFVDDAFMQEGEEMKRFDFKDYTVALQRGRNAYLVIAYSGTLPNNFDQIAIDLMNKIEKIYGHRIERFSGDAATDLAGIEIIFNNFIQDESKSVWTARKKKDIST